MLPLWLRLLVLWIQQQLVLSILQLLLWLPQEQPLLLLLVLATGAQYYLLLHTTTARVALTTFAPADATAATLTTAVATTPVAIHTTSSATPSTCCYLLLALQDNYYLLLSNIYSLCSSFDYLLHFLVWRSKQLQGERCTIQLVWFCCSLSALDKSGCATGCCLLPSPTHTTSQADGHVKTLPNTTPINFKKLGGVFWGLPPKGPDSQRSQKKHERAR